ncbi:mod-A protein [Podospora fimiseda]|uniref:Mod-A protein n=1 Tax=Podospora fimiseda TaxID=252190 RepID=A0AAN7BI63_9PEZI|nr:mod-A protein [Podospora fimiseda]
MSEPIDFGGRPVYLKEDDDDEKIINYVALILSVVALISTFAQLFQQYLATATGYSNCGEPVMGEWHKTKKRTLRASELRFEVQFETPVIFVCAPTNTRGPIRDKPILFVKGSPESLKDTKTLLPDEEVKRAEAAKASSSSSRVHTADNERATWVTMLSQLQSMERQSQQWQQEHYGKNPPPKDNPLPQVTFDNHTLAIAMQAKKRSWDNMPTDVTKPYATTTICHILEIAAMMGIYWQEFDRAKGKYRAEGNGYILTGTNVADLGLTFTFQICGKSKFQENRVIPADDVKDFCCGFVPTVFQATKKDNRRIDWPNEDSKDLSKLQFGSLNEIAETMVLMDCNTNTANYFREKNTSAKHNHLFPIPFELLGMLSKTIHIRNSAFRTLPNPTPYRWDKNFFNLRRLIREFWRKMQDSEEIPPTSQFQDLLQDSKNVVDEIQRDKKSETPGYSMPLLNTLHDTIDKCDNFIKDADLELIRMVLREHFQKVLKMINEEEDGEQPKRRESTGEENVRAERFSELQFASPETRQEVFMELYFYSVLPDVRTKAVMSYQRRQSSGDALSMRPPSIRSRRDSLDTLPENPLSEPTTSHGLGIPQHPLPPAAKTFSSPTLAPPTSPGVPALHISTPTAQAGFPGGILDKTTSLDSSASDIWCTLIFRMLCWLLLHDFDKKDVQIPKSELLGNRLPVYIL